MPEPAWLKDAILYQVYPQSFYDSNADGIGDLPGLVEKLDYIQWLGCDTVWVNPCFVSPFYDAGYDVADFYKVASRYGSNADLKRLFRQAHKRGMRVLLDLVPAHTSIEHPWFQQSARPQENKYTHWYHWTDSPWTLQDDQPFTFIRGMYDRDGCYIPNFFAHQPALNFGFARPDPKQPWQFPVNHPACKALRREMMQILRFWLDAGADGFRVDMASTVIKNDPGWKRTCEYWQQVRAMFDRQYPDAALLSEWSTPSAAIQAGFHADFMIQFNDDSYNHLFRQETRRNRWSEGGPSFFDKNGKGDITAFLDPFVKYYRQIKNRGYICLPSGNHDITRLAYKRSAGELEVAFAFLLTMPTLPLIYYGDEIGMRYIEGLPSKEGGYERTGSRTPMQWTAGRNAGFSTESKNKLYLPVDSSKNAPNVESQIDRPDSLLSRIRKMIELRKAHPALGTAGQFKPLYAKKNQYPLIYHRSEGKEKFLIVLNPSARAQSAAIKLKIANPAKIIGRGRTHLTFGSSSLHIESAPVSYGIWRF